MMKFINQYTKFIPYLYFISIVAYWFTDINKSNGITAYPILLLGIPFLWQIVKPNKRLNFILGITFVCLSSYLILAYLFDVLKISSFSLTFNDFIIYGGIFVVLNFIMALWILRNSIHRSL